MSLLDKAPKGDGGGNPSGNAGGEGGADPKGATGGEGNDGGAGGDTTMNGSKDDKAKDFKTPRPDHVPEKFWDAESGTIRTDDVLKSYGELEKQLTKAKEKPQAPEKYEYKVNSDLQKKYGLKETISEDDPYLSAYNAFAKEQGYSQEQYQKFLDFYIDMELSHNETNMNSEFAKLGDERKAIERVKNVRMFAKQHLSEESQQALGSLVNTAASVKLFEELATLVSRGRQPVEGGGQIEGPLSESEVDAMMKSEAYWNKKHPDHASTVEKVTKNFQRHDRK